MSNRSNQFGLYSIGHRKNAWFATGDWRHVAADNVSMAPYTVHFSAPKIWEFSMDLPAYHLIQVYYSGTDLETPGEIDRFECKYSLADMNEQRVAWLSDRRYGPKPTTNIMAGTSLQAFCSTIKKLGGEVYVPLVDERWLNELI